MLDSITSGLVGVSSRDFCQSTPREAGVIILVEFLQCPPPKICDGQKIAQNFSQLLTTFNFDREYLRNGSTYQKSEKLLIIYNPSHVRWKKLDVLWSANVKVIDSKYRENLKFALKFSVLESITSGIVEVFSLNFFMRPVITARGISSSWNWFCARTWGAGRPHVWLCHACLVSAIFRYSLVLGNSQLHIKLSLLFLSLQSLVVAEVYLPPWRKLLQIVLLCNEHGVGTYGPPHEIPNGLRVGPRPSGGDWTAETYLVSK